MTEKQTDIVVVDKAWIMPFADWVTPFGLRELPDDMPYDDWERLGGYISSILTASKWALGDWINYGEAHYGEKYTQAVALTGRSEEGLMIIASVARAYSGEAETLRARKVPWRTHQDLAATVRKDAAEADSILQMAEAGNMTSDQVRAELRPSVEAKPVAAKYTVDEIEALFECWKEDGHYGEYRTNGGAMMSAFLTWLRK